MEVVNQSLQPPMACRKPFCIPASVHLHQFVAAGCRCLETRQARNGADSSCTRSIANQPGSGYSEIWRLSRPCSGVTIQSSNTTRPAVWEDQAPAEPRFRRVQPGMPPMGRALPGMPLEMNDPDDGPSYPKGSRFGEQDHPWWRPSSMVGRVFVGLLVFVLLGGLAASAWFLKTYMGRDARFRIAGAGNIQATGLTEVSRAEMLPIFGEDIGRNVFFVPLAERRKQLEEIPWVEHATVMRLLPDQIRVSVVERKPVAFVREGSQIGLVDASGVLLSMPAGMMAQHHYSFPVVTGIDARDPLPARRVRMGVYQRLLAELDANNQHLSEQISEIDLVDPEDARVLMPEQGTDILAHFGEDRFLERYHRYKDHIAEWRQQYPKLSSVDLRYDQQVVLEMAPGSAAAPSATPEQAAAKPGDIKQGDVKPGEVKSGEVKPQITNAANKTLINPAVASKAASAKLVTAKAPATVKPAGKTTAKAAAAKEKAAKDKKKRADAKHAALNLNNRKAPKQARPAVVVSEGQ
jgi:cell division protein FtsQ